LATNQGVVGSNPAERAKIRYRSIGLRARACRPFSSSVLLGHGLSAFASTLLAESPPQALPFCTLQSRRRNTKRSSAAIPKTTAGNPTATATGGPSVFGAKRRGARMTNAAARRVVAIHSLPSRCNAAWLVSAGNGPTSGHRAPAARARRLATSA